MGGHSRGGHWGASPGGGRGLRGPAGDYGLGYWTCSRSTSPSPCAPPACAGLLGPGDRFVLPNRGMDDDVFVLSNMTVEVHEFPSGKVIGFNGVTEWALDSVDQREAVWLPAEHQLRDLLGGLFAAWLEARRRVTR